MGRAEGRTGIAHGSSTPAVAALIATRDRLALLRGRSLPSVAAQTHRPDLAVIVNDGAPFATDEVADLASITGCAQCEVIPNRRVRGAAGAWNTGLDHLACRTFGGFVAILDDDDTWDDDHVAVNLRVAAQNDANLVVAGLRMIVGGTESTRPLLGRLHDRDFLVGNPGWQGSNTFVEFALLRAIGGFHDGLVSLNDRDLAIRLLRHPATRPALASRMTASWHQDTPGNLSEPGSESKRSGLRTFWSLYGPEFSDAEADAFFARAGSMFGVARASIVGSAALHGGE